MKISQNNKDLGNFDLGYLVWNFLHIPAGLRRG